MPVSLTCVCGAGSLNLGSGQPEILPQIVLVIFFVGYILFYFSLLVCCPQISCWYSNPEPIWRQAGGLTSLLRLITEFSSQQFCWVAAIHKQINIRISLSTLSMYACIYLSTTYLSDILKRCFLPHPPPPPGIIKLPRRRKGRIRDGRIRGEVIGEGKTESVKRFFANLKKIKILQSHLHFTKIGFCWGFSLYIIN